MLVFLLMQSIILADIGEIKLKAKQDNEYIRAKIIIKNPMHGQIEENKRAYWGNEKREINFITSITVKSKSNTLLYIETSPFLPRNPLIRFTIKKDYFGNKIIFSVKDNNNNTKDKLIEIKNYSSNNTKTTPTQSSLPSRVKYPKVWKATTPDEAIKELYGKTKMIENVIQLKVAEISENSLSVPIMIKTDIDLESIVILTTNNPRSVVSIIDIPTRGLTQFVTRIKYLSPIYVYKDVCWDYYTQSMAPKITVIGKGRDGKLYKTTKTTRFSVCINSGSGIENLKEFYERQIQE